MHTAKFLPPCPLHILERERLVNRLVSYEDRKLIVIHGQAGQGKSTLAAGYVREARIPFVWYNLDAEDDNAPVFLASLAAAVHAAAPDLLLRPPLPGMSALDGNEQVVRTWVRTTFAGRTRPLLIVFDDLNAARPVLTGLMQALIEETPPAVRFMILSRSRPDLPLARLRAKRAFGEIAGDDLRFTDEEVQELFGSVFGTHLAHREAAAINKKAEGWPVGLVLMHEYLSSAPDGPEQRVHLADAGFRSHIFDYLAQEVFSQLPADLQQFLVNTSVADYLPEPLLHHLWEQAGTKPDWRTAPALLHELKSGNLFVTPLNREASMIRYHSLFREFLRKKLHESVKPAGVRVLYSRASAWFRKNGDGVRAVDLLLESNQTAQALHLIEASAAGLIARGRAGTLLRWRESVPHQERSGPWFVLSAALTCRFAEPRAALALFDSAFRQFGSSRVRDRATGRMLALCGLIEACFHSGGDFNRMKRSAALAQTLLARERGDRSARARLLLALGTAWFFLGRLDKSRPALMEALDAFRKQDDSFSQITCAVYLTPCALYQGDFRLARQSLARGFEAHARLPEDASSAAALFLTRAMTALFEGNFAEARDCIDRCKSMADHHALESIAFLSLDIEGWLCLATGDYETAARLLSECRRKAEKSRNDFFCASASYLLAITSMFRNRLAEARQFSEFALAVRSQSGTRLFRAIYLMADGAILMKSGRTAAAEKRLLTALRMLQQVKARQKEANAHLALALLYRSKGRQDRFRKHLQAGFSIGRELGFSYYAILTPPELADLAAGAIECGVCEDYCETLIDRGLRSADPLLTLECMGGFRVFRGRKEIREAEWKSRLGKTLLKMLAAHDGIKFAREQAIEMLWPEARPGKSRALFNTTFHRLRKMLQPVPVAGRDIFCVDREGDAIALSSDAVRVDVRQFLDQVERTRRARSGGRPADLLKEYEQCIDLYRGDFLPEDRYLEWAGETRDRLRGDYVHLLEEAAELAESLGEKTKAQHLFEKRFLADPCSEEACRWLMTRYLSLGKRGEAVRTYERCERALSADMDLEPEEKTKKLYRTIIGGAG